MKYITIQALGAGMLLVSTPAAGQLPNDGLIGVTRAVQVAEKRLSARAVEAELDMERGRLLYEVELVREDSLHQAYIDARTGAVVATNQPRLESLWSSWFHSDWMARAAAGRPLGETLARLERESGGRVQEVSFDVEDGHAHYEVDLATAAGVAEVFLNPVSGERLALVYDD